MSTVRDIIITLVLALCIFFAVHFTIQSAEVDGISMEPNFQNGQRLLVVKAVYWFGEPNRGDVIIFPSQTQPDENLIKRVVGLPGETVEVKEGQVYIDGSPLEEPYIVEALEREYPATQVPEGSYFVMGDNRNHSNDSRSWGPVPAEDVIGKVWLCYWPLGDWHLIPSYSYALE